MVGPTWTGSVRLFYVTSALTWKFTVLCLHCWFFYFDTGHSQLSYIICFLNQGWATARSQWNRTPLIHEVKSREISNIPNRCLKTLSKFSVSDALLIYLTRFWQIIQVWRSSPINSVQMLGRFFIQNVLFRSDWARPSSISGVVT
jgi:hypothetical protein